MAHRTTRRNGLYTETGRGSAVANVQKSKGVSIVTKFKGLQDNKNDVVAVQDSLADVDNLYIDDNDLLSSRPPVKSFTPVHTLQGISGYTSVRMWNIEGYIFRLLRKWTSENTIYYLICDNKIPVESADGDEAIEWTASPTTSIEDKPSVFFTPIEEKVFVWIGSGLYYFDTKVYRFKRNPSVIDDSYIYCPVRYKIVNSVYMKVESLNLLNTNIYRDRYQYSPASSIDFTDLRKWVRAYYANNNDEFIGEFNTSTYPNQNISPALMYPRGLLDEPDYYDIVEHENGITIMCWYKTDRTIKVSVDGRNYTTLMNMPVDSIIREDYEGHPFLSKDGSTVILFTANHIYFANVLSPTAENYMNFEEHDYFEGGTPPTIENANNHKIIAYFYNETIYAYVLQFTGDVNGTTYLPAKILCISHMRNVQRVDVINKSANATFGAIDDTDMICMCPRRMSNAKYVLNDGYYTDGPVYLVTLSGQTELHSIVYICDTDDPDDISGISDDYKITSGNISMPDIFDAQNISASYRGFNAIALSYFPVYGYDSNNDEYADVSLTAIYRHTNYSRIEIRHGYLRNGGYTGGAYTSLRRAHYSYDTLTGATRKINVAVSLSRVYFALKQTGVNISTYFQKYYELTDLPATPYPQVSGDILSTVESYGISTLLEGSIIKLSYYDKTNNLWSIKDGRLWTTMLFPDTIIYLDSYTSPGINDIVMYADKYPTHFAALQEYYFSFDNVLAVTATRRNEDNEFLIYLPVDDIQECISEITNLCPISTQYVGVFLEDSIWYAGMEYLNNELVHKKLMKSKIPFGCKKGTDILVTSDGQSIIFPTYRGIALLGPQDFVATTDPIIKYISDNIQNFYLRFYSETMYAIYQTTDGNEPPVFGNTSKVVPFEMSFVTYKYWMFMYKRYCREVLLYDMRDSTWWTWTMPYPVIDMVVTDRLYTLFNTPQCLQLIPLLPDAQKGGYIDYDYEFDLPELLNNQSIGDLFVVADKEADLGYALENFPHVDPSVDDFSYEDEIIPYTLNGEVKVVKDDSLDGSHVELDLPQSRIDWFLISQKLYLGALNNYKSITGINIVAKGLYEYGTKLTVRVFRNIEHPEDSIDMDIFVKDLRTFVQRLNLMHAIFFQYKLSNTDEDKQRQAHIASLCVKYETKEAVR